ncbi:MAG: hypothetical protein ABSF70_04780 [Terracidiphilus sp.]|jgi:uncharacterized membrane protein YqjE
MTPFWKIAASVTCVAVICGTVVTWLAHERKLAEAARICRTSAEQGDVKAQVQLGLLYHQGKGLPQDYAEALRWYRKAADRDDASGQNGLGYLYFKGQGVPQDFAEADRWYQKAADQGYAKAQFNLGDMYYSGFGVPQDNAEAIRWYREAADQGYARAQYDLGRMYYYGYGVPQDRTEADRWDRKAANQGDEYAQRALGLKGPALSTWSAIGPSVVTFGCLLLLMGSLSHGWRLRTPHQRALAIAPLLGLTVEGLSLYWVFGVFPSVSTVYAFFFTKNLLAGIFVAMLISLFVPRAAKIALAVLGILFACLSLLLLLALYHSKRPFPIRAFCSLNGMFIGLLIALAFYLWRTHKRTREEPNGICDAVAFEIPDESGE